jgi:hypothetical protein
MRTLGSECLKNTKGNHCSIRDIVELQHKDYFVSLEYPFKTVSNNFDQQTTVTCLPTALLSMYKTVTKLNITHL